MRTFRDVVEMVAPEIGGGMDANHDASKRLVRAAVSQILKQYPKILNKKLRLWAYGDMLVLPDEILRIKKYRFGGVSIRPQAVSFEFLEAGPGISDTDVATSNVLVDRGFSPVVYQPPTPLPLILRSDRAEDNAIVTVQGTDTTGKTVRSSNGTSGVSITLKDENVELVTDAVFDQISAVAKPKTAGYVSLYSYDAENSARYLLARYAPSTTVAAFRQYRLPGSSVINDVPQWTEIIALCVLKEPLLLDDSDIIPINDAVAIEYVARSIYLHRQLKYKESQIELQTGLAMIGRELSMQYDDPDTLDIQCDGFMVGDVRNL